MKRIKVLLLTAISALALTASMGPSVASASGIAFGQYPVTALGQGVAGAPHFFSFSGGRTISCGSTTYSGSASAAVETLATTVSFSECSSEYEGNVTVKTNGCKFIYHPAVGAGSFDIGPAGCGPITMEGTNCTRSFASQTGLAATFSNAGTPSSVTVKNETGGMQYTLTKGTKAACGSSGAAGLFGTWVLQGSSAGGEQVSAQVVPGTGVYMTGKESAEEASQPKFAAETYPTTLTGFQDPAQTQALTIGGNRKLECAEAVAHSTASSASSQLALSMEYGNCAVTVLENVFPTTVSSNGCNLVLHALNVGPPYSGSIDVACAKEGEAIEVNTYSGATLICTYKISPQTGLTGVSLTNVGAGTERGIATSFGLSGISVTRAKGTLAACGGATQSATYTGATTLHGVS
jgi:hypothetical protein